MYRSLFATWLLSLFVLGSKYGALLVPDSLSDWRDVLPNHLVLIAWMLVGFYLASYITRMQLNKIARPLTFFSFLVCILIVATTGYTLYSDQVWLGKSNDLLVKTQAVVVTTVCAAFWFISVSPLIACMHGNGFPILTYPMLLFFSTMAFFRFFFVGDFLVF